MDDKLLEARDQAILKALDDFMKLPAGDVKIKIQAEAIERLYKLKLTDDKQYSDDELARMKLEFEKTKANNEHNDAVRRLDLDETKIDDERSEMEFRRGMDDDKYDAERKLAEAQMLIDKVRIGADIFKVLVVIGGTLSQQRKLIRFEETGIARSKAWSFLTNIKNLNK